MALRKEVQRFDSHRPAPQENLRKEAMKTSDAPANALDIMSEATETAAGLLPLDMVNAIADLAAGLTFDLDNERALTLRA